MTRDVLTAVALAMISVSAEAAFPIEQTTFDVQPVSVTALAETHGTYGGSDANFKALLSQQTNADERVFSSVSAVAMDNWWADVGSMLVAASFNS